MRSCARTTSCPQPKSSENPAMDSGAVLRAMAAALARCELEEREVVVEESGALGRNAEAAEQTSARGTRSCMVSREYYCHARMHEKYILFPS